MPEKTAKYFPQNDPNHIKEVCNATLNQFRNSDAAQKPWEPIVPFSFNGRDLYAAQPFDNDDGGKVGYGCETSPVKWRLEKAITALEGGNISDAMDMIGDALREINQAEARKMPFLQMLPDNATITAEGELV